jgi:hypothetical protein
VVSARFDLRRRNCRRYRNNSATFTLEPMTPTAQRDQVLRPVRAALPTRPASSRSPPRHLQRLGPTDLARLNGFAQDGQPIQVVSQPFELVVSVVAEAQRLRGVQLQAGVAELAMQSAALHFSEPQRGTFADPICQEQLGAKAMTSESPNSPQHLHRPFQKVT